MLVKSVMKESDFQRQLLLLQGLLPGLFLLFDFLTGNLGANPPEAIIRTTGAVAILFIVLSLAVTPAAQLFKWPWLIKHRRWLGLWGFIYAVIHLISYSLFDKNLDVAAIIKDIKDRPFILLGFLAFLLLIPLAVTSTNDMIRKLGAKRWKLLHKLNYVIAILAVIHFWMIVKSDFYYPRMAALAVGLLLLYRLIHYRRI